MDLARDISIIFVTLGALFMVASIMLSVKTLKGVPDILRGQWHTMTGLMLFFFAGYVAYVIVQLLDVVFPLALLTGTVFLGGALFVFLVVRLSLLTITRMKQAQGELNVANEELVHNNIALEEEIAARKEAEYSLKKAHDELEVRVEQRTTELTDTLRQLRQEINERLRAEKELKHSHAELDQIFNTAADGMAVVDLNYKIMRVNDTFVSMTGIKREKLIGRRCDEILPGSYCGTPDCALQKIINGDEIVEREADKKLPDGKIISCIITATPFRSPDGELIGIIEDFRDITERKKLESRLEEMSITDELTGLLNRRGFLTVTGKQLELAPRIKSRIFMMYIDIDNMKTINDTLGHSVGDEALVELADILKKTFRKSDVVGIGRLGGDEFAILLTSSPEVPDAHPVISRLEEKITERNSTTTKPFMLEYSAGIIEYDGATPCSIDTLISRADALMYEVKAKKKNSRANQTHTGSDA